MLPGRRTGKIFIFPPKLPTFKNRIYLVTIDSTIFIFAGGRRLPATPPHPSALRLPPHVRNLNQPASGNNQMIQLENRGQNVAQSFL